MSLVSLGDFAQTFQLRRDTAATRTDIERLTGELASGRRADIGTAVAGDFGPITGIERSLARNAAFATAAAEAELFAAAGQRALGAIQDATGELGTRLAAARGAPSPTTIGNLALDAKAAFESAVSALNSRVGERTVFAGAATDGPALATAETMLVDLGALVAGETTAAGIATVVEDWFAPGGGFEAAGYAGAAMPLSDVPIGDGVSARFDVTAGDPALREVLKGLALGALAAEGTLAGDLGERADLVGRAGDALVASDADLTAVRARIGTVEARIEQAQVARAAESSALEMARNDLVGVDPYRAATELQAAEARLETIYTLTARLSRLSLVDFLQ